MFKGVEKITAIRSDTKQIKKSTFP